MEARLPRNKQQDSNVGQGSIEQEILLEVTCEGRQPDFLVRNVFVEDGFYVWQGKVCYLNIIQGFVIFRLPNDPSFYTIPMGRVLGIRHEYLGGANE